MSKQTQTEKFSQSDFIFSLSQASHYIKEAKSKLGVKPFDVHARVDVLQDLSFAEGDLNDAEEELAKRSIRS